MASAAAIRSVPTVMSISFRELAAQSLAKEVKHLASAQSASMAELLSFHSAAYVELVQQKSFERRRVFWMAATRQRFAACSRPQVLSSVQRLVAVEALMSGERAGEPSCLSPDCTMRRAMAARQGFCVFNDCGVAVECSADANFGIERIAYVDIDAHHGDGMCSTRSKSDPALVFADIHEDGRDLYPGTGSATETGRGAAMGCKLNLPARAWRRRRRIPGPHGSQVEIHI